MEFIPIRYVQCKECEGRPGPMSQPGFYYVQDGSNKAVVECHCHRKWVESNRLLLKAFKNNVKIDDFSRHYKLPESYKGTRSLKEMEKIQAYLSRYDEESTRKISMYFHGLDITQKTTVAQFIGLSVFRMGYNAFFVSMRTLNTMLFKPFPSEGEAEVINAFLKKVDDSDLLIIDHAFDRNMAPVYESGSQSSYIEGFLRNRIETKEKGVLFVSRVPPKEIKKNGYSESLQSYVLLNTEKRKTSLEFRDIITDFSVDELFEDSDGS